MWGEGGGRSGELRKGGLYSVADWLKLACQSKGGDRLVAREAGYCRLTSMRLQPA